jgi:hypothetical protein
LGLDEAARPVNPSNVNIIIFLLRLPFFLPFSVLGATLVVED